MKKLVCFITLCLLSYTLTAQSGTLDVVYLKNGSIIKGEIIEQIPNVSLKLRTADGNVFVYQMDEVEKLTRESMAVRPGRQAKSGGYEGVFEFGYAMRVGDYGMDRLKVHLINGAKLSPNFSIGFGAGAHYYIDARIVLLPVFASLRASFLEGPITPFISMAAGYTFNTKNSFKGEGVFLNPTAGFSFEIGETTSMSIGFGYDMQNIKDMYGSENSGALSINFAIIY